MTTAKMIESLKDYDTVSFDVFDTLLLRPYVEPTDLFYHMETNEKVPGFAKARIRAERIARSKLYPEITLSEIYDTIDVCYKDYMDTELKYEAQILQQNAEMKEVCDFAISSGKKVILVSDMYIPSEFVERVLKNKGFAGFDKLYVSCEYRKSKHSGSLFEYILKELNLTPDMLLHIGDNDVSDVRTPKRMGIGVIQYERVIDRYFKQHKREHLYYRMKRNWERSVIVGMDALLWHNRFDDEEFWHIFGCRYGGPVNTAFATFINENTEKDSVLLFVARDGYVPQKVYNILYGTIENHYIYATRMFNILFGINEQDFHKYEKKVFEYFSEQSTNTEFDKSSAKTLPGRNNIDNLMKNELETYQDYIKRYTENKRPIYVIDASTEKFSSQTLIAEATGKNVKGLYYTLLHSKSNENSKGFVDNYRVFLELTSIDVPEFLMTSPEPTVHSIDKNGNPVYSENGDDIEWYRKTVTEDIATGSEVYANVIKSIFGNYIPIICHETVNRWILCLARCMNDEEYYNLKNVHWASDPAHSEYHKLFFAPSDALRLMKHKIRDYYKSMMKRIER